ncbi:MAG: hypothetical protein ACTSQF_08615 [Candidatus Heimdallarchaeaceae archaeon]
MNQDDPFGFAIYPDISLFKTRYEIVDLSTDKIVFEIHREGSFKPYYYMKDDSGKEVLVGKKISVWSGIYRLFKNDIRYATFDYAASCCSSQIEIQIGTKRYMGARVRGSSFEFVDNYGNVAFYFQRYIRLIKSEYLVEVYDNIEPAVAILASVILDTIIRAQQGASVAATTAAVS